MPEVIRINPYTESVTRYEVNDVDNNLIQSFLNSCINTVVAVFSNFNCMLIVSSDYKNKSRCKAFVFDGVVYYSFGIVVNKDYMGDVDKNFYIKVDFIKELENI